MQILPFLLPCLRGAVRTARDGSAVPSSPEQSSWRSRASFLESWWAALLLQTRAFLCCSPSALGAAEFLCSYVMDCRWLCLENLLFFFTAGGGQEPCPTSAGSLLTELLTVGAEMPGRRAAEGSTGAASPLCPKHLPEPLFFPRSSVGQLLPCDLGVQTRENGVGANLGWGALPGAVRVSPP